MNELFSVIVIGFLGGIGFSIGCAVVNTGIHHMNRAIERRIKKRAIATACAEAAAKPPQRPAPPAQVLIVHHARPGDINA
jgi:hypothetical protein